MKWQATRAALFLCAVMFLPTGARVAASPPTKTLRAAGSESVRFSPDGHLLLCRSEAGALSLWDVRAGKQIWSEAFGHYWRFAFAPDGKQIAFSETEGNIYLRDARPGGICRRLPLNFGLVAAIAFAPDGKTVAVSHFHSAPDKATISFFNVSDGRLVRTWRRFTRGGEPASLLTYSPDNRFLAATLCWGSEGDESRLVLFDMKTGRASWQEGGLGAFDTRDAASFRFTAAGDLLPCGQKYLDLGRKPWRLHPLLPGYGERDFSVIGFYDRSAERNLRRAISRHRSASFGI